MGPRNPIIFRLKSRLNTFNSRPPIQHMPTGSIAWLFLLGCGPHGPMPLPWASPMKLAPPWSPNRHPCICYYLHILYVSLPTQIPASPPPFTLGCRQYKATFPDQGSIPGPPPGPSTGAFAPHSTVTNHQMPHHWNIRGTGEWDLHP